MLTQEQLAALKTIAGEGNISAGESERDLHSRDQSSHPAHLPDAVVWPESTAQVSRLAAFANAQRIPLTGWGAGTSLEGNPIPLRGGIVVDFGRMNRILKVYAADFQVSVQPGIFYKDMNKLLASQGLFFAPDPGANASIGGMIANNAAGTRTVKYGATRDNVLALEVVLANGEVIRTGSRSIKQSAGYDLTHLFVGSEGTLGLICEATLRLAPLPEHVSAVVASFASTEAAAQAVYAIMGSGLNPAALELVDTPTVIALNAAEQLDLPVAPNLFLEFHGASEATLAVELELVQQLCVETGGQSFSSGLGREARDRLWQARHRLGELLFRTHAGQGYLITDVAVPISAYPAIVADAGEALRQIEGVEGFIFGHAGDGNMHSVLFFANTPAAYTRVQQAFNDRVVEKALSLGGTCTGEHGIGIGKQKYMVHEHGESALDLMRRIKEVLDPNGVLNPGKVIGA
jgi:D-lactate dehydrogenase (cytochrome)